MKQRSKKILKSEPNKYTEKNKIQSSLQKKNIKRPSLKFLLKGEDNKIYFSFLITAPGLFHTLIVSIVSLICISFAILIEIDTGINSSEISSQKIETNKNPLEITFMQTEKILKNQIELNAALGKNYENIHPVEKISESIHMVKKDSEISPLKIMERRYGIYSKYVSDAQEFSAFYNDIMRNIPHRWPIRNNQLNINSEYGWRKAPFFIQKKQFHKGLDIKARTGDAVFAAADGVVKTVSQGAGGYGKLVVIEHTSGYETYYAHLNTINVKKNQIVTDEILLGEAGNSGFSTGPHLHYEIRVNGKSIDPADFIAY